MIIPRPSREIRTPGHFTLGHGTALRAGPGAQGAARLLGALLAPATGLPLPLSPAGSVVLALDPALRELGDEGYRLAVDPEGVQLTAARPAGLVNGVQTIRQLLPPEALSPRPVPGIRWRLPCGRITDVPAYPWRGAMLDVARHFQPVTFLKRFVDLLALHKLNVLHLHLTDDQGWRMPVDAYPRLVDVGSRRTRSMRGPSGGSRDAVDRYDDTPHGGAYTRAELRSLVAYAAERNVTVVPETEMPGHTRAALAAYPHLGNDPGRQLDVWTDWGVCDNILGVHDEVLDFCRTVLGEVMDVFPSRYVHVGGDECPTVEWEDSPAARRRARAEGLSGPKALHGWFLQRIGEHLLDAGRRPLCWAEDGGALPTEFTVMPWRDADHGLTAARRGHDVVMAPHLTTYLDYAQTDGPDEPQGQPGAVVDLRAVHGNDPAPADWEPEAAARVLGTQAQLWTEFASTPEQAEYLLFPRLCALADRSWNPLGDFGTDFLPALRHHAARLSAAGVTHRTPPPPPAAPTRTAVAGSAPLQ